MSARLLAALSVPVALLLLASMSIFSVDQSEYAVRMRFGQVRQADYAPGLHRCWPFERIVRVDRRVLAQVLQGETFLDAAQQGLSVDIDMSWRVRDPITYLRAGAANGNSGLTIEQAVGSHLADALRSRLKASYAQMSLAQILNAPRGGVSNALLVQMGPTAASLGVELIDARVKRIDPTDPVANAIYARMQDAYTTQARGLRADGTAAADRIRAAYRNVLVREGDILVVQPDGEFYKYLHNPARH
jgi:membrane protease subunit HflC